MILSFGGEALFAMFQGGGAVKRAERAAEAIRQRFRDHPSVLTSAGPVALSVSQAIHYGTVAELHLRSGDRRHYFAAGPSVQALARLEGRAQAGEVLLSRQAKKRRGQERRRARPPRPRPTGGASLLASYLDPGMREALTRFRGAFRRVAILFLETKGTGRKALGSWFCSLEETLDRYGGILLKSDLSARGTK